MRELKFVDTVEAASAADRVADELRASILSSRLKAGQEFSLRQVANKLGVSFIPVREALRTLEAEGLLITRRGRSASVIPLSHEELDSAFRLRKQIEPELAGIAATLHSPEDLDKLESLLVVCKDPTTSPDLHATAHIDFHLGLLRPAATSMDKRVLTSLIRATSRYARLVMEPLGSPPEQHLAEGPIHRKLLEAFRSRDPKAAHDSVLCMLIECQVAYHRAVPTSS